MICYDDEFALGGIEWWNALDESERSLWLAIAGQPSASPVDAYVGYLDYQLMLKARSAEGE